MVSMPLFTWLAVCFGIAAAQLPDDTKSPCPAGGSFCKRNSNEGSWIITKCVEDRETLSDCNVILTPVEPVGIKKEALCYESSPTMADAVCVLNGTAYYPRPEGAAPSSQKATPTEGLTRGCTLIHASIASNGATYFSHETFTSSCSHSPPKTITYLYTPRSPSSPSVGTSASPTPFTSGQSMTHKVATPAGSTNDFRTQTGAIISVPASVSASPMTYILKPIGQGNGVPNIFRKNILFIINIVLFNTILLVV